MKRLVPLLLLLLLLTAAAPARASESASGPQRVVSMNLCADQLALMLGAPGQVVSVSRWAQRPEASNLAGQAAALPANDGLAEQIFAMRPDLVLTGPFSNAVTKRMLERLGAPVAVVPSANSFAEVSEAIRVTGRAMGREAAAEALVADYEAELAAARARAADLPRALAATHYPNSYTSGAGTLAAAAMDAARLDNAAASLGLNGPSPLALERLVMLEPFLIRSRHISGEREGRAYENATHPALAALVARGGAVLAERWQVCGTPFVTLAIDALAAARR
ncbi:ABC transporter substrate-binding protein [Rubrimonas cliftonensis]|uniref:Iron complex transport system substrate-binding protein n=1 Tax=Rubrimonas cliftonensis TaxID=89524 RepID=A0A1H4EHP7_9RHOB|nr:ABC transporter substrate-binding protein [Rubrimonas cliftonensis]SEA84555.1 iron complex transport system substrate-binding protein [Rubrimonas cliftonensis]